ncbi:MAG: sulfotransferase family 2 domain-containing protein [Pseudomonadota bacterium]
MLMRFAGQHPFIFVANTKAASTSIEQSRLSAIADIRVTVAAVGKHMPLESVLSRFAFVWEQRPFEDFLSFAVMRDPLDWVSSWYRFHSRPELAAPGARGQEQHAGGLTFDEYWERNREGHHLQPQARRLEVAGAAASLTYLATYETLRTDLDLLAEVLALPSLRVGVLNRSKERRAKAAAPTPHTLQQIREHYQRDYELIGEREVRNAAGLERYAARDRASALALSATALPTSTVEALRWRVLSLRNALLSAIFPRR